MLYNSTVWDSRETNIKKAKYFQEVYSQAEERDMQLDQLKCIKLSNRSKI